MAVAGWTEQVYVRSDTTAPTSADLLDGLREFSPSRSADIEDITDFKSGTGYREKLLKLRDTSISGSGHFESADAPQTLIRTAWETGAVVHFTVYMNPSASAGSKGWRFPSIIESYECKVGVEGVGEFSFSAVGSGAPVAV